MVSTWEILGFLSITQYLIVSAHRANLQSITITSCLRNIPHCLKDTSRSLMPQSTPMPDLGNHHQCACWWTTFITGLKPAGWLARYGHTERLAGAGHGGAGRRAAPQIGLSVTRQRQITARRCCSYVSSAQEAGHIQGQDSGNESHQAAATKHGLNWVGPVLNHNENV